jgi:hypothetical protein
VEALGVGGGGGGSNKAHVPSIRSADPPFLPLDRISRINQLELIGYVVDAALEAGSRSKCCFSLDSSRSEGEGGEKCSNRNCGNKF